MGTFQIKRLKEPVQLVRPENTGPRHVPCNGCTLCCRKTPVRLFPEWGDDVSQYDHVIVGGTEYFLRLKDDGACVYLGETGCTIHERVPLTCRVFDCREVHGKFDREERREMSRADPQMKLILKRGNDLKRGSK